jgi:selenide,water dikinase
LKSNREFAECAVEYGPTVDDTTRTILFDPQTAGGLLISLRLQRPIRLSEHFKPRGGHATIVGDVLPRTDPLILGCVARDKFRFVFPLLMDLAVV